MYRLIFLEFTYSYENTRFRSSGRDCLEWLKWREECDVKDLGSYRKYNSFFFIIGLRQEFVLTISLLKMVKGFDTRL